MHRTPQDEVAHKSQQLRSLYSEYKQKKVEAAVGFDPQMRRRQPLTFAKCARARAVMAWHSPPIRAASVPLLQPCSSKPKGAGAWALPAHPNRQLPNLHPTRSCVCSFRRSGKTYWMTTVR